MKESAKADVSLETQEVIEIDDDREGEGGIAENEIVIDMTKMRLLPVNPIAYGAADQEEEEEEVIDLTGEIEEEECIDVTDESKKSPPPPPTLQENEECVICFEAKRTVVLLPCKHCCLCSTCALNATECPLCREEVKDTLEIYVI